MEFPCFWGLRRLSLGIDLNKDASLVLIGDRMRCRLLCDFFFVVDASFIRLESCDWILFIFNISDFIHAPKYVHLYWSIWAGCMNFTFQLKYVHLVNQRTLRTFYSIENCVYQFEFDSFCGQNMCILDSAHFYFYYVQSSAWLRI